jgi:hypothetical protein
MNTPSPPHTPYRLAIPQRGQRGCGLELVLIRHGVAADELAALGGEDANARITLVQQLEGERVSGAAEHQPLI